eukprot:CAMPEP_0178433570 /NCGR_PEP_ID=MMETSP0689_2-20121128/32974_1 /TAXON_ID=160604 /ORGANISM="Amphidinium massartii, Strain CS-259" /LENGTH=266 /DNA_ID=CAMNT_0020055603 /DNA_START=92 /DNA_END=892 /DNA_ORIENTATION=-
MARSSLSIRSRRGVRSLLAAAAVLAVTSSSFLSAFVSSPAPSSARGTAITARRAGAGQGADQLVLSQEEFDMILDQEKLMERKKYYIDGEVKDGNELVPWKAVDERVIERDAKDRLKKNGIIDPASLLNQDQEKNFKLKLIGESDVQISWVGGAPSTKVGFIVERKRVDQPNFFEIANYERVENANLLVKPLAGAEYTFDDELLEPATYSYRVLVRYRSGELEVVDSADIVVPESGGLIDDTIGAIVVVGLLVVYGVVSTLLDVQD